MDEQYREIQVWKCNQCKRTLQTEKGLKRHKRRCKYNAPQIEGQVSFLDQDKTGLQNSKNKRRNQNESLDN